jgi:crotonobetainyl-CoA:carnitine CoA-transferase CaiB-like acyl-CoA transferase
MLSPYRVLDLTDERGHFTGYLLAGLGAEVVAIEPPGGSRSRRVSPFVGGVPGPDRSLTHFAYNRGKRSVVLDLETEAGRDDLRRLAAGADVLLESDEPGRLARLGLGYDDLARLNPALVYVSLSAFGADGPKAHWPVTDLTLMASGCTLALTGDDDRPPVRVTVPQAFNLGAASAAGGALMALLERARSGRGQWVDSAAQQVVPLATQAGVMAAAVGAPVASRSAGGAKVGPMELRLVYPAADGHVSITHVFGASIGPATARLMAWVHEAGFCDDALRDKDWVDFAVLIDQGKETVEDWERAKASVEALTSSLGKDELLAGAMERRLLVAPIATPRDVAESEQLAHREFFDQVPFPAAGRVVSAPGPFAKCSAQPLRRLGAAPLVGEHTDEVLAEPPRRPAVDPSDAGGGPAAVGAPPADERWPATSGGDRPPLEGLRVVDFSWSIATPHFVRVLADFGATVVKVESMLKLDAARGFMPLHDNVPGVENSALYDDMNAGKLSLGLNLGKPEAREVVLDLARWADVVVESFSPRAMRAWGLDYARLREANPSLVMLSSCLTGQDGPLENFAGYGNLGAALAGFYGLAGWPDRPPAGPFGAYTDYTSTHLMLVVLLAALDHRRRTGEGQFIDVAQAEAAIHFLTPAVLEWTVNGQVAERAGNSDPDLAPHGVYPAAGDDQWVAVACQDDQAWQALCAEMGRDDLAADPGLSSSAGRLARRDELDAGLAGWTCGQRAAEVEERLVARGVAAHAVQGSTETLADPQLCWRGHFVDLPHPDRRCLVEATRFRLSRTPGAPRGRAPFLGEHTFEVLSELLGYDEDRIADLAAAEALE